MTDDEITAIVGWPTEPEMLKYRKVAAAAESADCERWATFIEKRQLPIRCAEDAYANSFLSEAAMAIREAH